MTANAVRLPRAQAARSKPPAFGESALAGWINFTELEPGSAVDSCEFDHEIRLAAPGLDLRIDTRRVVWHAAPSRLTFVLGQPTVDGSRVGPDALDDLLVHEQGPWRRLGGRYALARIDLDAGEVLLATDRFGVWPLAWSRRGPRVAFSDRADRVAEDESALDPQALFDYVYFHVIPSPRTVFRHVRRLEPATALRISCIGLREQSTWTPEFPPAFATTPPRADARLAETFRDAVRAAVLDEAQATQVGCFLSGGTDSSTVAGMLARSGADASAFSIGFHADGYDEMSYARIAARHFGISHHEYYVTADDLVRAVPRVASHYDGPFGNSSAVPAYYCALMARHHGVRRLLAGDGGDELFGGNLRYAKQQMFEVYHRLPSALRSTLLEPVFASALARRLPGISKVASYVNQARVTMPARMETYNLLGRFGADTVFTPGFLAQVDLAAPGRLQSRVYARSAGAGFVDRMLAYDWRFTLADNDLPKVTGTTSLAGLDVGFPLLADPIVDLSLQLGARDKVDGVRLRPFFKDALADFLPREILAKKKHGFGLPVGPWLVTSAPFRALAYESLNGLAERGLVRTALVGDLFSRRLEEHPGYYGEMVWVLMMLEQWMRSHAPSWSCR